MWSINKKKEVGYMKKKTILLILSLFIGINAVIGAICMFIDSTGGILRMEDTLIYLRVLPYGDILFQDYIFSGISLLLVNGITNIVGSILLIRGKSISYKLESIFGVMLMLWIIIQFIVLPINYLSIIFFILGIIQFVLGYICMVRYKQSLFYIDYSKYKNIGKDKDRVVIYFSREGYTKKIAYDIADSYGYDILEVNTIDKISGNLGFWWCGRFGLCKWGMKLKEYYDLSKYKDVIICSPIWVFNISSPIRELLIYNKDKVSSVSYVITHFMNNNFKYVINDMDKILNTKRKKYISYTVRFGKIIRMYEE